MLRKKTSGAPGGAQRPALAAGPTGGVLDRRTFLNRSGLAASGLAAASFAGGGMVAPAQAQTTAAAGAAKQIKTVCTHCSVGCTVIAEVENGVWIGQEPGFDSPFNLGSHCAKGASVREHGHGERRLKYPMKLVDGKYQKIPWDQAIDEIGDKLLEIRKANGPDAVYWIGGSKHSNEGAYLYRKFAAFWGTNNCDNQARICHSTTVAGVANTWGYGCMTNSYNDMHKSRAMLFIGSNAAEAHPVAMLHILRAKEQNNAPLIVCDPRFTRTAAHADEYVRFRSGTDVALVWGILWHIFENGWEDKEYIRERVWGMDQIRPEVAKWTPEEVERVTGVPGSQVKRVAMIMANNRPGTLVWCMGGTQHTSGNNNTRAYCILQLALGNVGVSGGGTNIFRGHDNVQGATDLGNLPDNLPGYYGLTEGAWKHWARVWDVAHDDLVARFGSKDLMEKSGIPESRWFDGVLEAKENLDQPSNIHALIYMGHAPNSQVRQPDLKKAMDQLDLLVVIDPYPTVSAVLHDRKDNTYLLPASTQFETSGSATASNRSVQWREKVIEPLFEVQARPRDPLSAGQEARVRRADVQAYPGERRGAPGRGHPARGEPRRLDHRLYRDHARAPPAAHGEPADLRQDHAAGRRRPVRWRVLRPALAVLGHARDEASGHAHPLRPVQAGRRGRPVLPRPLRGRAPGPEPARRGQLPGRLRDRGRLPRVHDGDAQEARLGRAISPPTRRP